MKALVTGASGFIGSKLILALHDNGYELRLLSRKRISNYDTVICNLGIDEIPERALDSIDIVFHLAGYTHDVENSSDKNKYYFDINVNATVNLMKIAANKGVKKFVFVSSVKAGGISDSVINLYEKDQTTLNDIYGFTKRVAEQEILKISEVSDISLSIIRPALVYGVGMKGNLADMINGIKKGWFPPLPETHNKRSMISITDLVDAIMFITLNQKSTYEVYIATDGNQYSSRDIYISLCRFVGKPPPKWRFPKGVFLLLAFFGDTFNAIPFNSHKYKKLFGSECYSSKKLNQLGFVPKYNLDSYLETKNH